MNETTLILPDIHHRIEQATKIINTVGADKVICLADIFDDFDDTPEMVRDSAEWLVNFVNTPNHIFLVGNHECHYKYPYRSLKCSGYEQWKDFIINDIVSQKEWDKLKWYHILDNQWLLTRAGLHDCHIPEEIRILRGNPLLNSVGKYIDNSIIQGLRDAANNKSSWALNAGSSRGGNQRVGGITWCDWSEFIPIRGINQVMGHTPSKLIRWANLIENNIQRTSDITFSPSLKDINDPNKSYNVCLDTNSSHYAIWNGKKLSIRWTGDI